MAVKFNAFGDFEDTEPSRLVCPEDFGVLSQIPEPMFRGTIRRILPEVRTQQILPIMKPKTPAALSVILAICCTLMSSDPHGLLAQESQTAVDPKLASPGESDPLNEDGKKIRGLSQIGKNRFEPSANRQYQIEQARKQSQARSELLRYYETRGVNFAQPTFDGMAMHPYPISRRGFYIRPLRPW